MTYSLKMVFCLAAPFALIGCVGITQIQDSVSKFDQATHAAADAELALMKAEGLIDIDNQFYDAALSFATTPDGTFDLTANYQPRQISPKQLETRTELVNAITLYADKMQALATGNDDTTLDTNSTTLAKNLSTLGTTTKLTLTPGNASIAADVEAGVVAIAKLALDNKRANDLKVTAQKTQSSLSAVIGALKNENLLLGKNIGGDLGKIELDLRVIAALSRDAAVGDGSVAKVSGAQKAQTFFILVTGRQLLHADLAAAPTAGTSDAAGPIAYDSIDFAKAVNAALDSVLSGNQAIASSSPANVYAEATDILQRAKAAQAFASSLMGAK